ncbi:gp36 protein [Mycobacterium tuberculosis]|nr:gp36 protein [Mycobacterium tuberculosis]
MIRVTDRTQIEGPFGNIADSVIKTVVDFSGSLFDSSYSPIIESSSQVTGLPTNLFVAPSLGINWVAPWALLVAPEPGQKGSVYKCKISDHTPKGWQHIIGGRSPKWLNDFMNSTFAYVIDSLSIVVGVTGIPSDLLSGFLNNSFLAFQLIQHYARRSQVGPYHPGIEVFHATASAPYNVETIFDFINAFWDSRGWTCAQVTFRNGEIYTYGKDIFRGALVSVAYLGRTKILTDYVENLMWRVDKDTRDILVQIGDGKAKESPLAKHQRLLTAAMEAINVLTLAPSSS